MSASKDPANVATRHDVWEAIESRVDNDYGQQFSLAISALVTLICDYANAYKRCRLCVALICMPKMEVKSLGSPDETRNFDKGKLELVKIGGAVVGRGVFQPGWRWSTSVKPIVKTKSCEAPHFQYHVSGVLHVVMDDGTERDCKAGDISLLPSGHDAWVVGNEPVVVIDFQGMIDYAKQPK